MQRDSATRSSGPIQALLRAGRLGDLSDGDLLAPVAESSNEVELSGMAFATLVERHGLMVLGTCRTMLRNHHDAEDAFQATFLVLVQRRRRLRVAGSLGPWLHAVAVRICLAARRSRARHRQAVLDQGGIRVPRGADESDPLDQAAHNEEAARLHVEIGRLPAKLRSCLVLCDLAGMSYAEAARALSVPVGTVQSRLSRARDRLRDRLAGQFRPVSATDSVLAMITTRQPVPRPLASRTVKLCDHVSSGAAVCPSGLGPAVANVLKGASSVWIAGQLVRLAGILSLATLVGSLAYSSQSMSRERSASPQSETSPRGESLFPRELEVSAGRGRFLVYELDREGNRIPIPTEHGERAIPGPLYKETVLDTPWAVVTGIVPNREILRNEPGLQADPKRLLQFYRRVELSRQERSADGSWGDWMAVDPAIALKILDNLPERAEEHVEEEFVLQNLVDPLPFRKDAPWSRLKVYPKRFLVRSRRPDLDAGAPKLAMNRRARVRVAGQVPPSPDSDELMFRSFDFTVAPGTTYRYRARLIVLRSPMDSPRERPGEWSEPTEAVKVP